jgi:hypothetical protein
MYLHGIAEESAAWLCKASRIPAVSPNSKNTVSRIKSTNAAADESFVGTTHDRNDQFRHLFIVSLAA